MKPLALKALGFCILLVAVCYANSLANDFIQDDHQIVASNPSIRTIAPLRFLRESYWPKVIAGGTYRPLTIFSFSIDYSIWKAWAPGFRLTNLALHALNGWLVFLLAEAMIGAAAWAAAAVYLVHPVHTEAVVGIVGRSELLAAAFFFSAWLLFRRGRTAWPAALFLLSLLSKENAIIFPAVTALDMVLLGGGMRKLLASWRRFAALGVVAAAYLTLRLAVLGELGVPIANQYMSGAPLWERWMTSGRVFLRYLRLVFAPIDVAGSYEFNSIPMAGLGAWDAWLGLALVALGVLLAVRISKARPVAGFAILFFFVSLLPVSSWFMPLSVLMAERFLYTPMFGIALLAGLAWAAIERRSVRQLAGAGALAIAIVLCISHNLVWANDFSFYGNLTRVLPNNVIGRLGYASALHSKGRIPEAQEQFEAGLRVDPDSAPVLSNLAQLLVETDPRKCNQARPLLERAMKSRPGYWLTYWVLGNCEAMAGNREKADEFYGRASDNIPVPDANLLFTWGLTREKLGKRSEAIELYRRAAALSPSDAEIRDQLARLTGGNP